MAESYTINLHLSNELRIAIGDITAHWSFLEWQVSGIIHTLLDLDPKRGRAITTQMNIRPKTEIVTLLMEHLGIAPEIVDEFDKAEKEITRLTTDRNQIIHGIWAKKKGSNEHYLLWYRGSAKNRIIGKAEPMNFSRAAAIAAQIDAVNYQLERVQIGLDTGELPPSHGKS